MSKKMPRLFRQTIILIFPASTIRVDSLKRQKRKLDFIRICGMERDVVVWSAISGCFPFHFVFLQCLPLRRAYTSGARFSFEAGTIFKYECSSFDSAQLSNFWNKFDFGVTFHIFIDFYIVLTHVFFFFRIRLRKHSEKTFFR